MVPLESGPRCISILGQFEHQEERCSLGAVAPIIGAAGLAKALRRDHTLSTPQPENARQRPRLPAGAGLPSFMRGPGRAQTPPSIFSRRAPSTSVVLAAVRMRNSSALAAINSLDLAQIAREGGSASCGIAEKCSTSLTLVTEGKRCLRYPRQRAGFSPSR
jgi:hypothetical protein